MRGLLPFIASEQSSILHYSPLKASVLNMNPRLKSTPYDVNANVIQKHDKSTNLD